MKKVFPAAAFLFLLATFNSASALQIGGSAGGNCSNVFCNLTDDMVYWANLQNIPSTIAYTATQNVFSVAQTILAQLNVLDLNVQNDAVIGGDINATNIGISGYYFGDGSRLTGISSQDTNWQNNWEVFDANMAATYYPLNNNPAGYLTGYTDTNCATTNSCENILYQADSNLWFIKQADGNVWYEMKTDLNSDINALINPRGYLTSYLDTNAQTACGDSQYLRGDGTCQTISVGVSGSGADGKVAFWNGATSLTNDSSFCYDSEYDWLGVGTCEQMYAEDQLIPSRLRVDGGNLILRGGLLLDDDQGPGYGYYPTTTGYGSIWMGGAGSGINWSDEDKEEVQARIWVEEGHHMNIYSGSGYRINLGNYFDIYSDGGDDWGSLTMNETDGTVLKYRDGGKLSLNNSRARLGKGDTAIDFYEDYVEIDGDVRFYDEIFAGDIFSHGVLIDPLAINTETSSRNIYVDHNLGSDSSNGTSWAQAFKTLQHAVDTIKSVIADDVTITIYARGEFNEGGDEAATIEVDKLCLENATIMIRADAYIKNETTTASDNNSITYTKVGSEVNDYWNGSVVSIAEGEKQQIKRVVDTIADGNNITVIVDSDWSPDLNAEGGDSFYIAGRARITQANQWKAIRAYSKSRVWVHGFLVFDFNSYAEGSLFTADGGILELNSTFGYNNDTTEGSEFGAGRGGRLYLFESGSYGARGTGLGGADSGSLLSMSGNNVFEDFDGGFYFSRSQFSAMAYSSSNPIYAKGLTANTSFAYLDNGSTGRFMNVYGQGKIYALNGGRADTFGTVELTLDRSLDLNGYALTTGDVNALGNINILGDINAVGGYINTDHNFQVGGVAGITDNTSYWLCTAADCSTKCQVQIKGGIITGCV